MANRIAEKFCAAATSPNRSLAVSKLCLLVFLVLEYRWAIDRLLNWILASNSLFFSPKKTCLQISKNWFQKMKKKQTPKYCFCTWRSQCALQSNYWNFEAASITHIFHDTLFFVRIFVRILKIWGKGVDELESGFGACCYWIQMSGYMFCLVLFARLSLNVLVQWMWWCLVIIFCINIFM